MKEYFRNLAQQTAAAVGSYLAFLAAVLLIVGWLVAGPIFHFSDTWQLVINTFTTIVTFLMVFLIQNTQNRDSKVIHLKLDELLRAVRPARTAFVNLEDLSDAEIQQVQEEFRVLREKYGDAVSPLHKALHDRTADMANKRSQKQKSAAATDKS